MQNHRTLPLFVAIACMVISAHAQQLPQLTQYVSNDYVFNPAVAGSRNFFELRSGHRYQWVGIQEAPRTFTLTGTTPVGQKMGVGGMLFTDIVGPTRRTGLQFSYAYHLKLNEDLRLSLALSGGLLQFLIDGSKIQLHDTGDPVMDDQLRGGIEADATFGGLLYHPKYWVGVSVPQLMGNKVVFLNTSDGTLSRMDRHYYLMGGYRHQLGADFKLEPSLLVKYVAPVPVKVDATLTLKYRDTFWVGGSYRTNDAICLMVGYWHKQQFQFGYSYDVISSNLKNYSTGTHEVMLAITIGKQAASDAEATP
ncbi:MAG: type IX secretion system membrane protein PorP/SprF [Flavobacteriales bacterium]|nr:type IX secretion system membrane protein PorP/SprF [Flavobacteriales bacterium]